MKDIVKTSKALSLVLRHRPESVGITLDKNGWANVSELLNKVKINGNKIDFNTLEYVVDNNNKKRFTFNEDKTKIRANQGHSISVELDLKPIEPPEFLYHGTGRQNINSIKAKGILKKGRQYVHLSKDVETAQNVGARHGIPVVLKIKSDEMYTKGIDFLL